ncbi:MAG: hypothetical protein J6V52_05190 [Bacteroidaceae bacterium]|nr:hypothetical protein [Bacteroidaceae bacterium]
MRSSDYKRCRENCGLSSDEGIVMDMLRRECSHVQIAIALNASTATVSRRQKSLYSKIDIEL